MGRMPVIVGATSALGLMSVISVIIGRVFSAVPASFSNTTHRAHAAAGEFVVPTVFEGCERNAEENKRESR